VKILEVHTRGKPLAKAIDLDTLAGQTPGFTGADLQKLVNEAALLAARQGKREIDHLQLEEGISEAPTTHGTRRMTGRSTRLLDLRPPSLKHGASPREEAVRR
jgi:ATP-dependent Zn protease